MTRADWRYHRKNCVTCARAEEYLEQHDIETVEQVDARKVRKSEAEALALLEGIDDLYVAKGKKVVHFALKKERPDDETLLAHLMGPSGNLRAPTIRRGKKMVVGFEESMYATVFGK